MLVSLQPVVMGTSCGLAAPQVWSKVSALETGWVLIEPSASQITESLTLRAAFDKVSTDERKEVVKQAQELIA